MFFSKFVKLCSSVGKSPGAVAKEMGINRSTVSCWKSRKSKPTDISLQKIANYFNVSVDYLLDKETKQGSPAIKSIGERIKLRREELNLSQEDLAKKIGYQSRSSINKIELGYQNLRQSKIKEIAEALETTPSYIMGWDDEQEKPAPDNGDELDMAEVVSRLSNEELYDLLDAVNKRLRELNR